MKRNKKIMKVSVGIPAYNEEKNIGKVLKDILLQKRDAWALSEILVYCDGCSDDTYKVVNSIKNKKIKVFNCQLRRGKIYRVNQMIRRFKGDVLVLFDADIRLKNLEVINKLIPKFRNPKVALVGGNSQIYPPKSFFQKAIYTSYYVYYKSREKIKCGHNVFGCTGACLATRREFVKKIYIPPEVISEDSFLYFACLRDGYLFKHVKKAVVYFKLAENLKDFLKQIFRTHPESVDLVYTPYFGELVKKEYHRPLRFYLTSIFEVMLKNPLGTLYMIILKLICKPLFMIFSRRYKLEWFTAISTK